MKKKILCPACGSSMQGSVKIYIDIDEDGNPEETAGGGQLQLYCAMDCKEASTDWMDIAGDSPTATEIEDLFATLPEMDPIIEVIEGDPREKGDDDGVEYGDPRDEREERLRDPI